MIVTKVIDNVDLIDYSGIHETTPAYTPLQRSFSKDDVLLNKQNGDKIYIRTADDITIPEWEEAKEDNNTYQLYDVVWKDEKIKFCSQTREDIPKMPNEYSNVDTSPDRTIWAERYFKFTFSNGLKSEDNTYLKQTFISQIHSDNVGNKTIWTTTLIYNKTTNKYSLHSAKWVQHHETEYCNSQPSFCGRDEIVKTTDDNGNEVFIGGHLRLGECVCGSSRTIDTYQDIFGTKVYVEYNNVGLNNIWTDGSNTWNDDGKDYYSMIRYTQDVSILIEDITPITTITNETQEPLPVFTEDDFVWATNYLVVTNGNVYTRTDTDAAQEFKTGLPYEWQILEYIDQVEWGWTYQRPSKPYAPFDNKRYTTVRENNPISFTVVANESINTIAGAGLIASSIKVEVYENDSIVETVTKELRCINKIDNQLDALTDAIYLSKVYPAGTKYKITFEPINGITQIAEGFMGQYSNLGLTREYPKVEGLTIKDIQRDEWGVFYGKSLVVKKITYVVDTEKDKKVDTNLILFRLRGSQVFIDASDNLDNIIDDDVNYPRDANIVGYLRNHTEEVSSYSEIATFKIEAEEIV
jgi:hypothetical protein